MRVAGFAQDRGACNMLRIKFPLEKIRYLQLCEVDVITRLDPSIEETIEKCDVMFIGRVAGDQTLRMISRAKSMGKKVVLDLDDNLFDVSVFSQHYKSYGVMPVNYQEEDGSYVDFYKDGEDGFDVKRNRKIRKSFIDIMRLVDCMTVTTEPLEKVYKRFCDRVRIVPNSIDFKTWDKPDISRNDGKLRILYTGAGNHREDWIYIYPILSRILKKYESVQIVLIGTDWRDCTKDFDYSRVEVHPWVDFEAYPYMVKSLCCDIGIAPISETDFNDARSELKWVEYASQKMPCVATNWGPYKRSVKNGETGILVSNPEEWEEGLSRLIEDRFLRETMGRNAYKECKRNFNLDYTVDKWVKVFQEVVQ